MPSRIRDVISDISFGICHASLLVSLKVSWNCGRTLTTLRNYAQIYSYPPSARVRIRTDPATIIRRAGEYQSGAQPISQATRNRGRKTERLIRYGSPFQAPIYCAPTPPYGAP